MPAYIILDVYITDRAKYEKYVKQAPETIAKHGGKYLVRGGNAENLEGEWNPNCVVVLEFESYERAKQWWESEEYRAPKKIRQGAAVTNVIVVRGV